MMKDNRGESGFVQKEDTDKSMKFQAGEGIFQSFVLSKSRL